LPFDPFTPAQAGMRMAATAMIAYRAGSPPERREAV
jgi:hypothetical protein